MALTLGEELTQKIGKSTVITQNVYFYPDLQDTGQYRWTFNIGTVTKISKWFGWQNQFGDIYVTNPPLSAKKNDVDFHHRAEYCVCPQRSAIGRWHGESMGRRSILDAAFSFAGLFGARISIS